METATAVIDVKRYPFLADLEEILKARIGFASLKIVLARQELLNSIVKRVEHALRQGKAPPPLHTVFEEVVSFYGSLYTAVALGDHWLISRIALAEAERAHEYLLTEPGPVVEAVARLVGVSSFTYHDPPYRYPIARSGNVIIYRVLEFSVSFLDYVQYAKRLIGDPSWRPTNQPVIAGRVYLSKDKAIRLLKEAVMLYVEEKARNLQPMEELPQQLIDTIRKMVSEARRPKIEAGGPRGRPKIRIEKGVIIEDAFPPCMKDILDRARRGEHLSHHERFAIATFLLQLGAEIDQVVDVFRNLPDFNEKITRYQVEHLAGLRGSMKKYRTYSCEKMKTLGLCRAECGTRSPISAYYRSLAKMMKQGRRIEEVKEVTK